MCDRNMKLQLNNNAGSMRTALLCVEKELQQLLRAASDNDRESNDGAMLTSFIQLKTTISF